MGFSIENNSGTTFISGGGDLDINVKSNIDWEFKLIDLDEEHKDKEINYYFPKDGDKRKGYTLGYGSIVGEEEFPYSTTEGPVDVTKKPQWLNIINSNGEKVKTITGNGTTVITIKADENLTDSFLYALGLVISKNEEDSNLGGWCKFMIYDKTV